MSKSKWGRISSQMETIKWEHAGRKSDQSEVEQPNITLITQNITESAIEENTQI